MRDRAIIPIFIPNYGCPHRCIFCDQRQTAGVRGPLPSGEEVRAEIRKGLTRVRAGKVQVAFYGGTFTALPLERQRDYLEAVRPFIEEGSVHSLRVSTRPDAIDPEVLRVLEEGKVETVELGAQSMDPEVLQRSGRGYGPEAVRKSAELLRERGFELGIQIMVGLPGDTPERFMGTVREVIALRPSFVRIYPTLVIRGTELEGWWRKGLYRPLSLEEAVELSALALREFEEAGIKVIRIGLQPNQDLEASVVAGPYHPAFGQLARARALRERAREALAGARGGRRVRILVNPRDVGNLLGQGKENLRALRGEFPYLELLVEGDPRMPRGRVRVEGA